MAKTSGEKLLTFIITVLVTLLCMTMVYPFLHVFSISLSTFQEAYRTGFHFLPIPGKMSVEAYKLLFESSTVIRGYANSILVTAGGTALALTIYSLLAYPLSRTYLPFRGFFNMMLAFTMLFSGGMIPTYMVVRTLKLMNTLLILMLQGVVSAFNIFIIRNFFMSIPQSIEESAIIDGAGHFATFLKIILPLSKAVLTTIGLWVGVYHWNAWFAATLYIQDSKKLVLQAVLRNILILMSSDKASDFFKVATRNADFGQVQMKAALIMASLIPILVIYPWIYKYFEKGIMVGSVKG